MNYWLSFVKQTKSLELSSCFVQPARQRGRHLKDLSVDESNKLVFTKVVGTNIVNKLNTGNFALNVANFKELPSQSIAERLRLGYEFVHGHYTLRPRRREALEIEEIHVTSGGAGDSAGGCRPCHSAGRSRVLGEKD